MNAVPELRRIVVGALATNCWILHATGDRRAVLIDPGDDPTQVLKAIAGLDVVAVVLTHTHFDHVLAVPAVVAATGVPVLAHPAEKPVWPHELATAAANGHWDAGTATRDLLAEDPSLLEPPAAATLWDGMFEPVVDGDELEIGPLTATVLHTPGHTPGGICLAVDGHLFTGDTLFPGGPGLTGPPLSDFPTILDSVQRLLELPAPTQIHPGHGRDSTVAAESPQYPRWAARGW